MSGAAILALFLVTYTFAMYNRSPENIIEKIATYKILNISITSYLVTTCISIFAFAVSIMAGYNIPS
jgi:hypothetical protein